MKIDLSKPTLKSVFGKIALNVLLIIIAVYFMFQFSKTAADSIETERAGLEICRNIVEIDGYIFRNEEIIYSTGGNSVNYLIENGGKVGKNQLIAQSRQAYSDFSAGEQISDLEKKLDILDKSNINLDFITINLEKITVDSHDMYVNMLKNLENGKIRDAGKNRNELLVMLNKKQLITGTVKGGSFDDIIASVKEEKKQLEARTAGFGTEAAGVYSKKSGIFYSRVDGYENIFNTDALKSLDFYKFDELIKKEPENIIINSAIGKVAYDFNWYLVCKTEKSSSAEFIADKKYDIIYQFSSGQSVESVLTQQIDSVNSNEIILIFEASHIPVDFDFSRKQAIQIKFSEVRGIKVPEEALRVVTGTDGKEVTGVYVRKGNNVVFRELPQSENLGKFNGYYLYLEPSKRPESGGGTLQLYEDIITAGIGLYDGKIID